MKGWKVWKAVLVITPTGKKDENPCLRCFRESLWLTAAQDFMDAEAWKGDNRI